MKDGLRGADGFFLNNEEQKALNAKEKRDRRNDLAKEAMKITIELRSGWVGSGKFKEVATDAYAYADAMLAASGDYDES